MHKNGENAQTTRAYYKKGRVVWPKEGIPLMRGRLKSD